MPQSKVIFKKDLKHLKNISGFHFTPREIDIISCLIHGRSAKKIAALLSVGPKHVANCTYNIRAKLGCNARDGILDFCEQSGKIHLLRQHYANLVNLHSFGKTLEKLKPFIEGHKACVFSLCGSNASLLDSLRDNLESDLTFIGISARVQPTSLEEKNSVFVTIGEPADKKIKKIVLDEEATYFSAVLCLLESLIPSASLKAINQEFLQLHKKISKLQDPVQVIAHTKEPILNQKGDKDKKTNLSLFRQRKSLLMSLLLGGSFLFFLIFLAEKFFYNVQLVDENLVISPLVLPKKTVLLERKKLLDQIHHAFQTDQPIKTIALVGIGGAGKTTLARLYARSQQFPVIWEINAENIKSLKASLENFAHMLATDVQDKTILNALIEIKDPVQKDKQLIKFIREHLKSQHNWLLIYDNVTRISDIESYFPTDARTWGNGRIILTTRNTNAINSKFINNVIQVKELTDDQKINLFTKILYDGKDLPPTDLRQINAFLKVIPSFPLDVSVAAYYLKVTSISFKNYLDRLRQYREDFENVQFGILKEVGDYVKTRYSIVILSLTHLMNAHKDFTDLLLFISLLDSQNIPRDLFDRFKDKHIVDNFIFHAKKYSLVDTKVHEKSESTLSLHRSTQAIIQVHLLNTLPTHEQVKMFKLISNAFNKYVSTVIDVEDLVRMKNLIPHCKALLSHDNLIPAFVKAAVEAQLGTIYYLLGQYVKSRDYLEKSLSFFDNNNSGNPLQIQILDYLGIVHKNLENYEKSKSCLEKSLLLQQEHPTKYPHQARTLSFLGSTYRYLGQYKKAQEILKESLLQHKKYTPDNLAGISRCLSYLGEVYGFRGNFENAKEALEESIEIHKKIPRNPLRQARVLGELGKIYRILGEYNKSLKTLEESKRIYEYYLTSDHEDTAWASIHLGATFRSMGDLDKAEANLEKALTIYKKGATRDSIPVAWVSMHLADTLQQIGVYERAETIFKECLRIYKARYSEDNIEVAHISFLLGVVFRKLGKLEIAKELLQNSLKSYEDNFGIDHFENAYLLIELGIIHLEEGDLVKSESYLHKAKALFQKNNHPNIYLAFENLADFYYTKASVTSQKQQKETYIKQAKNNLSAAYEIASKIFPSDSQHVQRILSKIKNAT